MQMVKGDEPLDKMLYHCDRDEVTALIEAVIAEGSLQFSIMHWANITRRVLHMLDLVDSDPNVNELVSSCVKATYVSSCAHIVFIVLYDLEIVFLRKSWTRGGWQGGLGAASVIAHPSLAFTTLEYTSKISGATSPVV